MLHDVSLITTLSAALGLALLFGFVANRIVADGDFWGQLNFLSFKLKRNHKAPFATRISRLEEGLCLRGNRLSVVRDPVWVLGPRTGLSRRSA